MAGTRLAHSLHVECGTSNGYDNLHAQVIDRPHRPVMCDRGAREKNERKMSRARKTKSGFSKQGVESNLCYCAFNGIYKNLGNPKPGIFCRGHC